MDARRVRITWYDGTPAVDQMVLAGEVPAFLAPYKDGRVFFGTSAGGRLDQFIDGKLTLVGTIEVTDAKPAAGQPNTTEGTESP